MGHLDGRVAVVTGAGRGIGASVAKLLASEGASVVVCDRGVAVDGTGADTGPAQQTVQEIKSAGGEAVANTGDVTDFGDAESMIRAAIDSFGKLDVLVNVAGILRDRMVFNMAREEWDAVVDVHMTGTFNTTRHAAAYWRELRDADAHHRIVNFTSGSGLNGAAGQPNYAAAKMGIVGLTYSCANALRRYGVTANAIAPGASTRMTATVGRGAANQGQDAAVAAAQRAAAAEAGGPAEGERSPDNVAPAVAYLASERSDWCTGQVIGASGYQVSLYNKPEVIRQLVSTGPWELDRLFGMIERSFRGAVGSAAGRSGPPPTRGA